MKPHFNGGFRKKPLALCLQRSYPVLAGLFAALLSAASPANAEYLEITSLADLIGVTPQDDILLTQNKVQTLESYDSALIDGNNQNFVAGDNFSYFVKGSMGNSFLYVRNSDADRPTVFTLQNFGVITDGEDGIPVSASGGFSNITLTSGIEIFRTYGNTTLEFKNFVFDAVSPVRRVVTSGQGQSNTAVIFNHTYVGNLNYTGTSSSVKTFVDLWFGDMLIDSSLFENNRMNQYSFLFVAEYSVFTQITHSKIANTVNDVGMPGGIFYQQGKAAGARLTIMGSYFIDNHTTATASIYANNLPGDNLIENSVFDGNSSNGYGGVICFGNSLNTPSVLTIKDSTFTNNISSPASGSFRGGAIAYLQSAGLAQNALLNIISEEKNTVFSGNATVSADGTTTDAIRLQNVDVNLNAAEGKAVILDDAVYGANSDGSNYLVNVNKPGLEYSYVYQDADGNRSTITKPIPYGGELRLNDAVYRADIHVYGGTVSLLAPNDADRSAVYENTRLKTSHMTIEADTFFNLQDETPVTEAAFNSLQEAEILALTTGAHLQKIYLGDELTLNGNMHVLPAVNLETATSDTFTVGGGSVTGDGRIVVGGWIVTADKASDTVVKVHLADSADAELREHFALGDGGKTAYGPVYVWDVKYAGDSLYEFVRREPEPYVYDHEVPGGEAEDIDPAIVLTEDEPTDYNPDVYAEQVVALSLSVIQHAISDTVFAESGVGRRAYAVINEKPERKQWWGKVLGADLDLKTKNFHKIDMDYAIGMIGHQFDPIQTGIGDFEFGAYLGAATARSRYAISKISQNGGFLGGSVLYKSGYFWAGAHVNAGIMTNHLKGLTDNRGTNPWIGAGASLGLSIDFPAAGISVTPMTDVSYVTVKAKDFTTDLGARVTNSSLHSFEVSPGLRIDKHFKNGWSAGVGARYAFVTKHDGDTTAQYSGDRLHVLPSISNKNYAEYGVGVQKQEKNLGFGFILNRSDGGRRGWSGMARVSYSF